MFRRSAWRICPRPVVLRTAASAPPSADLVQEDRRSDTGGHTDDGVSQTQDRLLPCLLRAETCDDRDDRGGDGRGHLGVGLADQSANSAAGSSPD